MTTVQRGTYIILGCDCHASPVHKLLRAQDIR
jgi:hypothetical protein